MSESSDMSKSSITGRILLKGTLKLDTPLRIGSGEKEGTGYGSTANDTDISVLTDRNNVPFIPGTSLAGCLRQWAIDLGGHTGTLARHLFGQIEKDIPRGAEEDELQSSIALSDIVLSHASLDTRDGVAIHTFTGVGKNQAKYDFEVVERGAEGPFEMLVTLRKYFQIEGQKGLPSNVLDFLKLLADKLYTGFRVGSLTMKGLGQVHVENLTMETYDFSQAEDVKAWLLRKPSAKVYHPVKRSFISDKDFVFHGDFALRSSLIIRDYDAAGTPGTQDPKKSPDAIQLKSGEDYLIPGTTMKGILRHGAENILLALKKPESLLDGLMGFVNEDEKEALKSRFQVDEVYFREGVTAIDQSRNRIDRFTGGTMDTALFTTQPVWQKKKGEEVLKIHFEIRDCRDWEAGLALFLLKDLWTGHMTVGGEKSIGRGGLEGISGTITFKGKTYSLNEKGLVTEGDIGELNRYARALAETGEAKA